MLRLLCRVCGCTYTSKQKSADCTVMVGPLWGVRTRWRIAVCRKLWCWMDSNVKSFQSRSLQACLECTLGPNLIQMECGGNLSQSFSPLFNLATMQRVRMPCLSVCVCVCAYAPFSYFFSCVYPFMPQSIKQDVLIWLSGDISDTAGAWWSIFMVRPGIENRLI